MTARSVAVLALAALAGCAGSTPDYDPGVTAADFVQGVDNPFLPYPPGGSWLYELRGEEGTERITIRVLQEKKDVIGVQATVVRDTVTVDGQVVEDTFDWFAQDRDGNVWYVGEDTKEYEDGEVVGTGGSWQWGVDGALPGIIMYADPQPGDGPYFQEFYPGEAMDEGEVIDRGRTVTTPAGTFTDTVTTHEWNRLEGGDGEIAHYARGVGPVQKGPEGGPYEELLSYTLPPARR